MKTMNKRMMMLVAGLAWAGAALAATHEGVQLWENGPLWAKTNVGANSPTETGYYFWWGDTLGYKWQNSKWVASDGSVNNFSFSTANCPTYGKSLAQLQSMGYVGQDGNLLPAHDAAAQQWGDDWRVPKLSEFRNLMELCTWTWTTNNNVVGYTVTGKGLYSGNSIFIPATGYISGTTTHDADKFFGWSSTPDASSAGIPRVCFKITSRSWRVIENHWEGLTIRPVKSMSAAKAASAVALDTRTGTRVVKTTESIAYDVAWGGASSGTLKVNGTAVSGLSSKGNYSWTPNTSQTNYWKLTYTAGTANYSATFKHLANYAITYADTKGAANSNPAQYNYDSSITFAALPNVTGYVFNGWNPTKIATGVTGAFEYRLQGLAAGTTYAYEFSVSNNAPTAKGTVRNGTFTMLAADAQTASWTQKDVAPGDWTALSGNILSGNHGALASGAIAGTNYATDDSGVLTDGTVPTTGGAAYIYGFQNNAVMEWTLDNAMTLERLRISACYLAGSAYTRLAVGSVSVKLAGSDAWTALDAPAFSDIAGKSQNVILLATLSDCETGVLSENVVGLRIVFGNVNALGSYCAEIEAVGQAETKKGKMVIFVN